MPATLGVPALGTFPLAGLWFRVPPAVNITSPLSGTSSPSVTTTWTYSSEVARPQTAFRVRLLDQGGSIVLYDSLIVVGAVTTFDIPYLLSDLSTYTLAVSAFDGFDWSPEDTVQMPVSIADIADYPALATVGTVYEIGVNSVGYMLADSPVGEFKYQRQTAPLDSPRFATGETPFTEAVDRYTFIGHADWTSGAGQKFLARTNSDTSRFHASEGVNPFNPGQLTLLNATAANLADSHTLPLFVVAGGIGYQLTGAKELTELTAPSTAGTVFSVAAAGTVSDMTSDGTNWYVADKTGVWRNSTDADPGGAWSTINCEYIGWAGDRICGSYDDAGAGGAPNVFTTLAPDGTEEVASGRIELPAGTTIRSFTSGDGYVWFTAERGGTGSVYAWQTGTADTPFSVWEAPAGQYPTEVFFYQGNLLIRTTHDKASGSVGTVWRGPVADGRPSPEVVLILDDDTVEHGPGVFAGSDRFVLFSWSTMQADGKSGIGAIDLATGGYSKFYAAATVTSAHVRSITYWDGEIVIGLDGVGTDVTTSDYVTTGHLDTSHSDLGTAFPKIVDGVKVIVEPLPADTGLSVSYSLDAGSSYTALPSLSTAGSTTLSDVVQQQGRVVGLRLTLTSDGDFTPVVNVATIQVHPLGLADQVVTVPIVCADTFTLLNGAVENWGQAGGMAAARTLENLVQSRVLFQDVDYQRTGAATVWEVVGCQIVEQGAVMARASNERLAGVIAVLTLRRSFK